MRRFLMAGKVRVSVLDLDGDVSDLEVLAELVADLVQEPVVGRRMWHDQVDGKRGLRGAHAPNVQVVNGPHTGKSG